MVWLSLVELPMIKDKESEVNDIGEKIPYLLLYKLYFLFSGFFMQSDKKKSLNMLCFIVRVVEYEYVPSFCGLNFSRFLK